MIGPPLPVDRHWNTWDSGHPACFLHLPSRLALRISAFSSQEGRHTTFPAGPEVRLQAHESDGAYVCAELRLAGTLLRLELAKADPFAFAGRVELLEAGEWALRFWIMLEIGFSEPVDSDPSGVRAGMRLGLPAADAAYSEAPVVRGRWRSQRFCVVTADRPTYAGLYDDPGLLSAELEQGGYFRPHPQQPEGRWAVLRFSGQSQGLVRFALAGATDDPAAELRAREVLQGADALVEGRSRDAARGSSAARAVRDVVAWNTVLDRSNLRWYTLLTRNWTEAKFGGWGVWLDDVLYHALLAARTGDVATARANVEVALTGQQAAGNLPCLLMAYNEWVDRSQPPIGAYVVYRIHLLTGDRTLLEATYPTLRRAHDWWFEHRDGNGNAVLEYGSSPTGDGTFVHTKQAALNEAAMDNLPLFDDARFDDASHTLDFEEVGLNSLVVLEGQMLARIADALGHRTEARSISGRVEAMAARVREHLWDPERRIFAGRYWSGDFSDRLAPTSFYPLVAGIATPAQAEDMVRRHLVDPERFWGERPLSATPYDDPATQDDVYWRGRIWPPLSFLTWEGLRRYGYDEEARVLAERSWAMFAAEWETRRNCRENFMIDPEAEPDVPDSDAFYTWGALMALMPLLERADVSPWHGLRLSPDTSGDVIRTQYGSFSLRPNEDGSGAVELDGRVLMTLSPVTGLRQLRAGDVLSFAFEPTDVTVEIVLVGVPDSRVVAVEHAGTGVEVTRVDAGVSFRIDGGRPGIVTVHLRPPDAT